MAGFRELLAVEWDDNAVECFRLNFPGIPVYHGDINALTVEEVLRLTGLRVGELDLFDGSPPCQGFSTAGKRDFDDPRNQLFRQYVRLLKGLQPRVFVMENVSGMVKGKMKLIFADVLTELRGCGYRVEARVLNAACFGVPQARMRMIFVGVREDLGLDPSHPTAQTAPIALRDALPELAGIRTKNDKFKNKVFPVTHPDPPRLTPKYQRLAPMIVPGGRHGGSQSCARADATRPAHTLNRSNTGTGFGTPLHPYEHRSLSIPEAKRIGSFPDGFRLLGSFAQQWARIGNSVPPLLARAIGRHLREHILRR
jgi:DNA (cytosine-5)-methyltransferase 1